MIKKAELKTSKLTGRIMIYCECGMYIGVKTGAYEFMKSMWLFNRKEAYYTCPNCGAFVKVQIKQINEIYEQQQNQKVARKH